MNKKTKIIICGVVAAICVSLLYFVLPTTNTFIVSYIFAIITIGGVCGSLCIFIKGKSKSTVRLSYIYSVVIYALVSTVFSTVACLIPLSAIWTFVIHTVILGAFTIRIILLSVGGEYINDVDKKVKPKLNEFLKEKEHYWK